MSVSIVYVGIDVAKATLEVARPGFPRLTLPNSPAGYCQLLVCLAKINAPVHVVFEATGGYESNLAEALHQAGVTLSVINPRCAHHFAQAHLRLAKTDSLDALGLADFGARMAPKPTAAPTPQQRELAELVLLRGQLLGLENEVVNHLEHGSSPLVRKHRLALQRTLKVKVKAVDKAIAKVLAACPVLKEKAAVLEAVPGIGPVTAAALLSGLPELGTLSRTEVAAIAGLAPHNRDSGLHQGRRAISGGRHAVRKALWMPTLVSIKHNPILKAAYDHLRSRGKPAKVALTAIARKLLIHLNCLLKNLSQKSSLSPC
jgi:transposase